MRNKGEPTDATGTSATKCLSGTLLKSYRMLGLSFNEGPCRDLEVFYLSHTSGKGPIVGVWALVTA